MILNIPSLLADQEVTFCRQQLEQAKWASGNITAGQQSQQVKNNQQLPESAPESIASRAVILSALQNNALFFSAALPKKIYPLLFNRYQGDENAFGFHIDNAIRGKNYPDWVRTDLSITVFLSEPSEYEGGELVIDDVFGCQRIKLAAGDAIVYPSGSVHCVTPVTSGARLCSFSWIESLVRCDQQRRILFDLDVAIVNLRQQHQMAGQLKDGAELVQLTGCYHNLLRMWANT